MVESFKEKIGQLTENKKMGADLLFMNTYMASLALASASRPEIFTFASNRKEYVSSKYIAKVDTFVKKWNYSHSEVSEIVAERTNNTILQSMLYRYANAIESGVPDDEFLKNELQPCGRSTGARSSRDSSSSRSGGMPISQCFFPGP